jgi:plasmid stability protein
MRTTIRLDDELLAELKIFAALSGKALTAEIEDAVRAMLARQRIIDEERPSVHLTSVSGQGLQPGVDLDDSAALLTNMEEVDNSY